MKNREPIRLSEKGTLNAYYDWLCDFIEINQPNKSYWLLTKVLYSKEFDWFVPNDDNRAHEAKNLREQFCTETNVVYIYDYFPSEVSMLELIIGLAIRCESIMVDLTDEDISTTEWFWKILSNVRLDEFTDEAFYDLGGVRAVERILDRVIERKYLRNGEGGLFPLRNPKKDQRKVELWYQMNLFLVENYYTEDIVV